jgi:hypothetical protein
MSMEAKSRLISRKWMLWMSENLLRDCTPHSMPQTVAVAGLDPIAASQALQDIQGGPVMRAARRHQQITRKLESIVLNQCRLQQFRPAFNVVEKRKGLSEKSPV